MTNTPQPLDENEEEQTEPLKLPHHELSPRAKGKLQHFQATGIPIKPDGPRRDLGPADKSRRDSSFETTEDDIDPDEAKRLREMIAALDVGRDATREQALSIDLNDIWKEEAEAVAELEKQTSEKIEINETYGDAFEEKYKKLKRQVQKYQEGDVRYHYCCARIIGTLIKKGAVERAERMKKLEEENELVMAGYDFSREIFLKAWRDIEQWNAHGLQ